MKKTLLALTTTLMLSTSAFADNERFLGGPHVAMKAYEEFVEDKLPIKQGYGLYKRELVEVTKVGKSLHRKFDFDKSRKELTEAAYLRGKKLRDLIEDFEENREERICNDNFMQEVIEDGGKIVDYYRYSGGKHRMSKITVDDC